MSQTAKQQLDLIQSMLQKGSGFQLCPYTLPLWGLVIGLQPIFSEYLWHFIADDNVRRAIDIISLVLPLCLVFFIDRHLTLRWKARHEQVMPMVQKQIMRAVIFSLLIITTIYVLALVFANNPVVQVSYIYIVSIIFFYLGLFSNRWYCWSGAVFALLSTLLVFLQVPASTLVWFGVSVLIIGFTATELLTPSTQGTTPRHIISSIVLGGLILAGTIAGHYLHYSIEKYPGELPVYQLSDEKPQGRYILELAAKSELSGDFSVDRFTIWPEKSPQVTVKINKNIQLVFNGKDYENRFRVMGKNWENREPFQSARQWSYVHVTTLDGLRFDFFLPYFLSKQCDCIALVE
ncbi:MAG: hypothetical protein ACRBHB_05795 [Arenicella sp.]